MAQEPPLDVGPVDAESVRTPQIIDSESGNSYDASILADIGSGGGSTAATAVDRPFETANEYLADYDYDLSQATEAALNALPGDPGSGLVYIGPPAADGPNDSHQWETPLSLDLVTRTGAEIMVGYDVPISVPIGEGEWGLTVDNTGSFSGNHPGARSKLHFAGGYWDLSPATNPAGWCRLKDTIGTSIDPGRVEDVNNSNDDATAVSIENHDSYSESTHVSGEYGRCDRGVDFVPASETGGSGSDSFHDTYVENLHINAFQFGLRLRGAFDYSQVVKPALFAKRDGAICLILGGGRMDGTDITGLKCESPGNFANTTAVKYTGDPFYAPTLRGRIDGFGIDTVVDTSEAPFDFLGQHRMRQLGHELINWKGGDIETDRGGGMDLDGGLNASGNGTFGGWNVKISSPWMRFRDDEGRVIESERRGGGYSQVTYPFRPPYEDLSSYGSPNFDRGSKPSLAVHTGDDELYLAKQDTGQWEQVGGSNTIAF